MTPKQQANLHKLNEALVELTALDAGMAASIINEATIKAKRLCNRLNVPDDAERVEFVQDRGPTIEFTGRKLWEKDKGGYLVEFWTTLSGEWILLLSGPHGNRAWTFIGDEREPHQVLAATGYAEWTSGLVKGMGWSKHLEID